jgi:tetratricopeptide (TPR) repeat protein
VRIALAIALFAQIQAVPEADVRRVAMEGWNAARALAPKGGAIDLLGPVNVRLKELDAMPNTSARYAEVAIRAAISAAQEERDEMQLFLDHAGDLSKQMALAGTPARFPLPIDELAGELWLEVDRFEESRDAYRRATENAPTPNAWVGLARASDKLGDLVAACAAYTRVTATQGLPPTVELEVSLYLLKCRF